MTWRIVVADAAADALRSIRDKREQQLVIRRIDGLAEDPDKQGKTLRGELTGYRSVRAAGQRYRVIFALEENRVVVTVVALGRRTEGDRKDIYELARKILKSGLG